VTKPKTKKVDVEPTREEPDQDQRHIDRAAELRRQADVEAAVTAATIDEDGQPIQLRSASWRRTEPLSTIRSAGPESRDVEGIAVPYGTRTPDTAGGPEAFAPGAFRGSVEHWMGRQDGARMAFRPAHGERPIGTVSELRDTPAGVEFRASIFETPAGDEYLSQVRSGLNGVSIEFAPGAQAPSRMRDGTVLHRDARMHAIAGSVSPAYDGARIALRDMEAPMTCEHCGAALVAGVGHSCQRDAAPATPPATAAASPAAPATSSAVTQLTPAERAAAEAASAAQLTGGAAIRITRPEAVYARDSEHVYMRDAWLMATGSGEAADRVRRHQALLHDVAVAMERDAYSRIFDPGLAERAGDVLSSEIPGAYPNEYLPGLLTPRVLKGRPMGGFYQRIPISDARPRIFPKVTTSTTVAVQSAEGAALSAVDLATTAVTATPLMYGAYTDVSRQALDGGDPSVLSIIYQDLIEAYSQASEAVIKTAVEAGSTASGVAITAATPWAGELANVVNYYGTRFKPAQAAFVPSALYSVLLAQGDTTGRPFMPMIGATNSDGSVQEGAIAGNILGAKAQLSWASTVNVNVFGIPSDFVIFESAIAQFQYDQVVGPQNVRVGLWAYLVVGTRLGSLKVTAA
jgi:phage head maturation protease